MRGIATVSDAAETISIGVAADQDVLGLSSDVISGNPAARVFAGDALEVRHYDRLAPLTTARRSLPRLAAAQRGDCLVAFSRREVHGIKREVEGAGRHACCVVRIRADSC